MPDFSKRIVYLTQAQYQELITNGTITVDGVTVTYNANDIYVTPQAEPVTDVRVDGTSITNNGVANVTTGSNYGIEILRNNDNTIAIVMSEAADYKTGAYARRTVTIQKQHIAVFYGLAKAAGSDEKNSTLAVGSYTESAKSAISTMLSGSVSVSGSTPTINALPGVSYECGEVSTLDIAVPESGCFDVAFESGSTPTALSIPMPTGYELIWENGFDPTNLDANTVYEINLRLLGTRWLGVAGQWATT